MGTLSKRTLSDFGDDIKERIEGFRSTLGSRIDRMQDDVKAKSRGAVADIRSLPASTWFALAVGVAIGALATLAFFRHSRG